MNIFEKTKVELQRKGFKFERTDFNRPWGGFFVIKESQATSFINEYFTEMNPESLIKGKKVSPKILLVAPKKRLSWQYHHRRSEVWKVISNEVGIIRSESNEEGILEILQEGDRIILKKGERHRLVGLSEWSKIAEIWQHTDNKNPSDEDDIVRLQDDYKR